MRDFMEQIDSNQYPHVRWLVAWSRAMSICPCLNFLSLVASSSSSECHHLRVYLAVFDMNLRPHEKESNWMIG